MEHRAHARDDQAIAHRIQPHVRVAVREGGEPRGVEQRHHLPAPCRRLELGLEAVPEEEHHVRRADPLHIAGGDLEVVRLGSGRGRVVDPDPRAGDLPGGEGQGVEAGDDALGAGTTARARRLTAGGGEGGERHENDFHSHRAATLWA